MSCQLLGCVKSAKKRHLREFLTSFADKNCHFVTYNCNTVAFLGDKICLSLVSKIVTRKVLILKGLRWHVFLQ